MPWHTLSRSQLFEELQASDQGLPEADVSVRRERHGQNELPRRERRRSLHIFVHQFRSSLIIIMLAAVGISLVLGKGIDAGVIMVAIVLNVVVGFLQELKADRSLEELTKAMPLFALVRRDGRERRIEISELVPGDVVLLRAGDSVPADGRLLHLNELEINEAPLTGESKPVKKTLRPLADESLVVGDRTNMVFMGTNIVRGEAAAIIVATGKETEIGRIAEVIRTMPESETGLQQKLRRFSRRLSLVILAVAATLFGIGLTRGHEPREMFTTAVAVAVSAIPEGLVISVTVILAIGMRRILHRKAIVRNLLAAETLGSTTVICTDKTGTLTEGNMDVVRVITNNHSLETRHPSFSAKIDELGSQASLVLAHRIGVLCNDGHIENETTSIDQWEILGNPTDRSLLKAGGHLGLHRGELEQEFPRLASIPFTSDAKFMATLHRRSTKETMLFAKGAPEQILARSSQVDIDGKATGLTPAVRSRLYERVNRYSQQGLRLIALAQKPMPGRQATLKVDDVSDLVFVGFLGIADPIRPDVAETITQTAAAGIRTIMITGDHHLTARAVAKELGLPAQPENILEGKELAGLSQTDFARRLTDISVYARVGPTDKLRIIDAWQKRGDIVAMTGDGINDAPALRSANIGVALGSGTDIAKETADIVLLDNKFPTIVAAVAEGRVIFDNIRKVVLYLLSDSFSEVILIAAGILFGLPLPLTAAQILWINILTDGFPNLAMTFEPGDQRVMQRKPESTKRALLTRPMTTLIAMVSGLSAIFSLILFTITWRATDDLALAQTMAFAALGADSLLYVFSIRSLDQPIWRQNFFANGWLIAAASAGAAVLLAAIYVPAFQMLLGTTGLALGQWGLIILEMLMIVAAVEIVKMIFRKRTEAIA